MACPTFSKAVCGGPARALRITAQLIEAATGAHLWAERYDRSLDDIFVVQDEVAQTIVTTLVGRIEDARLQQVLQRPTASLAAYDYLLRGIAYFRSDTEAAIQQALEMFEKAIALDARYAVAHSYRAFVKVAQSGFASAPVEVLDRAFIEAKHAIELDPLESRCHRILSTICFHRREYDQAEQHLGRAFELNPNDADGLLMKGRLMTCRGRPEEALTCLEAANRLNPLRSRWYRPFSGIALFSLRRFEEAAHALKQTPLPTSWSHARLAACYAQLGRTERHRQRLQRSCGCSPTSRRRSTCARASCLNTPRTGSFSAKGSSRPDCRRDLVRGRSRSCRALWPRSADRLEVFPRASFRLRQPTAAECPLQGFRDVSAFQRQ